MSGIPYTLPHAGVDHPGGLLTDVDHDGGLGTALTRRGFPAFSHAGIPFDGKGGTFAGLASKGAFLLDLINAQTYQNTGTLESPVWTLRSGGGGSSIDGLSSDGAHGVNLVGGLTLAGGISDVFEAPPDPNYPIWFSDGNGRSAFKVRVFGSGSGGGAVTIGDAPGPSGWVVDVVTAVTDSSSSVFRVSNVDGVLFGIQSNGDSTFQRGIALWNHAVLAAQPVLATGAGATVDDVIALLQSYGICKQS